ncbi:unnamed protein product [Meganyctiphanes norvegica]|uniref:Uncharacterized protein n=1 Tax=Meganyctiphanes norvegica TaxID=48144 RepID=A0AAV2SL19_MEGNR
MRITLGTLLHSPVFIDGALHVNCYHLLVLTLSLVGIFKGGVFNNSHLLRSRNCIMEFLDRLHSQFPCPHQTWVFGTIFGMFWIFFFFSFFFFLKFLWSKTP